MLARRSAFMSEKSGFEIVGELADHFNCQICAKLIHEPHLALCCGQYYCASCLKEWFDRQHGKQTCPHCCAEGDQFNHVFDQSLRNEIDQLKIKCRHHQKGCKWTGGIGELESHLSDDVNGCGYVVVKCSNKCIGQYGPVTRYRKDLMKHLNEECDLRPYQCDFCGFKDTYTAITGKWFGEKYPLGYIGGHHSMCPQFPVFCPNECGVQNIRRKNIDSHRGECPNEITDCTFVEAGCSAKFVRHELDSHLKQNQSHHLFLLMKDYRETKCKLNETKKEMRVLNGKLTAALQLLKMGENADKADVDLLLTYSKSLAKCGDLLEIIMPKFSEYRRSRKVWHSPPFYYREGYKMCLAVYANGVGEGAGTHISIALVLFAISSENIKPHENHKCVPFRVGVHDGWCRFSVCAFQPLSKYTDSRNELERVDKFCDFKNESLSLVDDCLSLNVQYISDCYLTVCIL